jgi:hypothetical protein
MSTNIFQTHNTNSQVIIATIITGGDAIDLHDISPDGSFPCLIISPRTFYTKNIIKASDSVFCDSVTSRPTVNIVCTIVYDQKLSCRKSRFCTLL